MVDTQWDILVQQFEGGVFPAPEYTWMLVILIFAGLALWQARVFAKRL